MRFLVFLTLTLAANSVFSQQCEIDRHTTLPLKSVEVGDAKKAEIRLYETLNQAYRLAESSLRAKSSNDRVIRYRVIHQNTLLTKQKKGISRAEVEREIQTGVDWAIGYKCGLRFEKVSGFPADFSIYVKRDRNTAAGYYRHDHLMILEAADRRGWSPHKIRVIAAHEFGHSPRFWGGGHDNSKWTYQGKRKTNLMSINVSPLGPTYTSPKESRFLKSRYGNDSEIPAIIDGIENELRANGKLVRKYRGQLEEFKRKKAELFETPKSKERGEKIRKLNASILETRPKFLTVRDERREILKRMESIRDLQSKL